MYIFKAQLWGQCCEDITEPSVSVSVSNLPLHFFSLILRVNIGYSFCVSLAVIVIKGFVETCGFVIPYPLTRVINKRLG